MICLSFKADYNFVKILFLTLEIFLSITKRLNNSPKNILWIALVIAGFYEFL